VTQIIWLAVLIIKGAGELTQEIGLQYGVTAETWILSYPGLNPKPGRVGASPARQEGAAFRI